MKKFLNIFFRTLACGIILFPIFSFIFKNKSLFEIFVIFKSFTWINTNYFELVQDSKELLGTIISNLFILFIFYWIYYFIQFVIFKIKSRKKDGVENENYYFNNICKLSSDDCLNNLALVNKINEIIIELKQTYLKSSFKIGINGKHGAGKTSIINAILNLENIEKDFIKIEIYPWILNTEKDLIIYLIEIINSSLNEFKKINSDLSTLLKVFDGKIDLSSVINRFFRKTDLSRLKSSLLKSRKKILFAIYDLDRANRVVIDAIFSMMSTFLDLPNTIFLLEYDESGINKNHTGGQEILDLEKFVDIQFDVNYETDLISYWLLDQLRGNPLLKKMEITDSLIDYIQNSALWNLMKNKLTTMRKAKVVLNDIIGYFPTLKGLVFLPHFIAILIIRREIPWLHDTLNSSKKYLIDEANKNNNHLINIISAFFIINNDFKKNGNEEDISSIESVLNLFSAYHPVFFDWGKKEFTYENVSKPHGLEIINDKVIDDAFYSKNSIWYFFLKKDKILYQNSIRDLNEILKLCKETDDLEIIFNEIKQKIEKTNYQSEHNRNLFLSFWELFDDNQRFFPKEASEKIINAVAAQKILNEFYFEPTFIKTFYRSIQFNKIEIINYLSMIHNPFLLYTFRNSSTFFVNENDGNIKDEFEQKYKDNLKKILFSGSSICLFDFGKDFFKVTKDSDIFTNLLKSLGDTKYVCDYIENLNKNIEHKEHAQWIINKFRYDSKQDEISKDIYEKVENLKE